MPASYTHQFIADGILEQINIDSPLLEGISDMTSQYHFAYLAGAEGPDPLFFVLINNKKRASLPELGHKIHKSFTGLFLSTLINTVPEGDDITRAFVLGFLTHYAADTTMHPFIYSRSFLEDGSTSGNKHCKYEHILDPLVWQKYTTSSQPLPTHMLGYIGLTRHNRKLIASHLSQTINMVFTDTPVQKNDIFNSFSWSVILCNILKYLAGKKKSLLLDFIAKTSAGPFVDSHVMINDNLTNICSPLGYNSLYYSWDYIDNSENNIWHSYWEPKVNRTESVYDLIDKAKLRGSELIENVLLFWNDKLSSDELQDIIGDYSYDSGLSWQNTEPIK